MLEINRDSYVTIEEADEIVRRQFFSTDDELIKWEGLSDGDKEVALRNSCQALQGLKYKGERKFKSQILEFPRSLRTLSAGIYPLLYLSQNEDNRQIEQGRKDGKDGLEEAKLAQVVNAVYGIVLQGVVKQSTSIQLKGLKGIKSGVKSENYGSNSGQQAIQMANAQRGIYTDLVEKVYLNEWVSSTFGRIG